MKTIYISICLLLITTTSFSQWLNLSSGTVNHLSSIDFPSANTGYAVGYEKILKTSNAGTSWTTDTTLTGITLKSVFFTDDTTGYAVGNNGVILKTINGGTNWFSQSSGTLFNLNSVFFINSLTGFAVGDTGTILKTIDGGINWTNPAGTGTKLFSVFFINATTGFAVGDYGQIIKTTNGGTTWNVMTSNTTNDLTSVYFTSANVGFAVGKSGTILKTVTGGTSWNPAFGGGFINLNSVYFPTYGLGYIAGDGGKIFKSTNGGDSWSIQTSYTSNNLNSVHFTSSDIGYSAGNNGTIIKTTSGGIVGWYKYANEDTALTIINTPVTIHVLANDSLNAPYEAYNYIANPETCDYPYVYGTLQSEHGGTLSILNSDSILYTPANNFVGWDNFLYGICDNGSTYETDTARVFVNVLPILNLDYLNGGVNDTLHTSSFPVTLNAGNGWQNYFWSNGSNIQTTQATSNGWYWVTVSTGSKFTNHDSIYVKLTTKTPTYESSNNITLYPNPNNGKFYINIESKNSDNYTFEILDLTGQIIYYETINHVSKQIKDFDIKGLPKGIYFLKITNSKIIQTHKLIVQ